ncbi:MAG: hypothetical protein ACFCU8_18525 [Thermosynechococcaceae cyanobacterium]
MIKLALVTIFATFSHHGIITPLPFTTVAIHPSLADWLAFRSVAVRLSGDLE